MSTFIWTALLVSLATIIGFTSSYLLKQDNVIEEACEEIIKEKTGLDLDLTPSSKESKS